MQIPISTADQLLKIGSDEQITINGNTYTFSRDAEYILQNDISFCIQDYIDQYPNSFGTEKVTEIETTTETYTNEVTNYETANTTDSPYSTYTAKGTGTYKLEVWGAQGGRGGSSNLGGKGGYSVGTITLSEGDCLYVYVGGQGSGSSSNSTSAGEVPGGYNGGGNSYQSTAPRGSGGGATDVRIGGTTYYHRVIVAGGGGGNLYYQNNTYKAGVGGGTSGTAGDVGYGGTQTAAGTGYSSYATAGFGYGGYRPSDSTNTTCGGGGGWYGGGAGNAAGGGSGFVWTSSTTSNVPSGYSVGTEYYLADAATYAGNTSFASTSGGTETGHSGDGYARITLVSATKTIEQEVTKTRSCWITIEQQKQNGNLTGKFIYNGYIINATI